MIDRYIVRAGHEWAFIYLDSEFGSFMCQSSYGTYAYMWRSIGTRTLKEFLAGLDFDYFMKKTRPDYRRFDFDKSVERMKQVIVEERRGQHLEKEEARRAWNELEQVEYTSSQDIFLDHVWRCDRLHEVLGSEFYEFARVEPDGNSREFWKRIWPDFLRQATVLEGKL